MAKLTIVFKYDPITPVVIDGLDRFDIDRVLAVFNRKPPAYNPEYKRLIIDYETNTIKTIDQLKETKFVDSGILFWPADSKIITQDFGERPFYYKEFGLPAHEGIDINAPTGANIYSCFKGEVISYSWQLKGERNHNYGKHIRIKHSIHGRDYISIYAHLSSTCVKRGKLVTEGELIGTADSTGNSSGSHLHFTFKLKGATANGETTYPFDIIDPGPYLGIRAHNKSKSKS